MRARNFCVLDKYLDDRDQLLDDILFLEDIDTIGLSSDAYVIGVQGATQLYLDDVVQNSALDVRLAPGLSSTYVATGKLKVQKNNSGVAELVTPNRTLNFGNLVTSGLKFDIWMANSEVIHGYRFMTILGLVQWNLMCYGATQDPYYEDLIGQLAWRMVHSN